METDGTGIGVVRVDRVSAILILAHERRHPCRQDSFVFEPIRAPAGMPALPGQVL
jgi:hypothetical protein